MALASPGIVEDDLPQGQQESPAYTSDDLATDKEATAGNSMASPLNASGLDGDDVIGVSISRAQNHMRSPRTPAAEKARAMNLPLDDSWRDSRFTKDALDEPGRAERGPAVEKISWPDSQPSASSENEANSRQASPWKAPAFYPQRFSFARTVLGESTGNLRRRSFSGPQALMSNLRKLLPDIPSPSLPKASALPGFHLYKLDFSGTSETKEANSSSAPPEPLAWSDGQPHQAQDKAVDKPVVLQPDVPPHSKVTVTSPGSGPDGNAQSRLSPVNPAPSKGRLRANSESSLYINRRISGVSAYDDITAFANVTDMANSRLKAITDSFQNSTLRLPKLPNIRSLPKLRSATDRVNGEENPDSDSRLDTRTRDSNVREVRRGVEVETPQQRAHPILTEALSKTTGDVVLLGGYRGSVLRSAKPPHRQLWAPVKVGLNLRQVDLEVGLTREDEERMEETIIPSGTLSHIGPIDICRRLLRHLKKCPNAREGKLRVHDWGYDWRLSPDLLSRKLITFLESLECNHAETPVGERGAIVIAHSLGGLVTRHAVNQRPDLFAGVVYAGVPQDCVNILGPLRNGDDVLLSSRVLTAQVNFTLRTSYALLPEDGRCFFQKHTNTRYDLDFFDPKTFDEFRLSPCINPPLHPARKSIIGSLSESISSSLPSIPTMRTSWLGGRESSLTLEPKSTAESAKDVAADGAPDAAQEPDQTSEHIISSEDAADHSFEPSLKQSQTYPKPSVATLCTIPKDKAYEYLARTLAEVKEFKRQLAFIPSHQEKNLYPPHAYIFGKTVPTVYGARVANKEAIKYTDAFDDLAFAAGDGVVLARAAQLPEGYRCVKNGRVESDRGHVGLLGDLESVGTCLGAVVDARAKGVGLGTSHL